MRPRHSIRRLLLPALASLVFAALAGGTAAAGPIAAAQPTAARTSAARTSASTSTSTSASAWQTSGNVHGCGPTVHLKVPTQSSDYFAQHPAQLLADPASGQATSYSALLNRIAGAHIHYITSLTCGKGRPGQEVPKPATTGKTHSAASAATTTPSDSNWGGYQSQSTNVKYFGAAMDWTVPAPQAMANSTVVSSIWPGIGSGDSTEDTLIQAGTGQDNACYVGCYFYANVYDFWLELYPQQSQVIVDNMAVYPGDAVAVLIQYDPATQTANFLFTDFTQKTGGSVSETVTGTDPGSGSQAEWILERTEVNGSLTQLGNFGTLNVTGAEAYEGTTAANAQAYPADDPTVDPSEDAMHDCAGQQLEQSSPITGGTAFSISWLAFGTYDPVGCTS